THPPAPLPNSSSRGEAIGGGCPHLDEGRGGNVPELRQRRGDRRGRNAPHRGAGRGGAGAALSYAQSRAWGGSAACADRRGLSRRDGPGGGGERSRGVVPGPDEG